MNRLVLVGGGSSSGKSYITSEVMKRLGEEDIVRLTMDDYYKDQSDISLEDRYKVLRSSEGFRLAVDAKAA